MDCCPFPQAKGLIIDICRGFYVNLANSPNKSKSSSFPSSTSQTLTELKRAPINPQLSSSSSSSTSNPNVPIKIPNKSDTIETKQALKHIEEMKNLESYHLKLDEYCSQYFDSNHSITTSILSAIFLDLFVFPPLRLISQDYQSINEVFSKRTHSL